MSSTQVKRMLGEAFQEIAQAIETGNFKSKVRIGLTTLGSEHGVENMLQGAELASRTADYEIVLIGPRSDLPLTQVIVEDEADMHRKMEELLDSGQLDACVSLHYNFPIGVSTVGKVITPGKGTEMFLATTTGTSATNRSEAMFRNAVYGIIAAKAMGIAEPSVGILNVDNARIVERALKELNQNGYPIRFGGSMRSDGGSVMRGNDLLTGSVDVMVTDTLTGNILMKMFSSFATGGSYEATGFGYGPGIGEDYHRTVLILSRASGVPVVAGALQYAASLVKGGLKAVAAREFKAVKDAGFERIIQGFNKVQEKVCDEPVIKAPDKEVVTGTISGIDIMDLDNAVHALWKSGIYAESGMGCTGPIVMISEQKLEAAMAVLAQAGFVAKPADIC